MTVPAHASEFGHVAADVRSSGDVPASGLSEAPNISALLLEAGRPDYGRHEC